MKKYWWSILAISLIWLFGCKKEEDQIIQPTPTPVDKGSVSFHINYSMEGNTLEFDTIKYTNEAGNQYSVSKLMYYIANFTFRKGDGSTFSLNKVQYVDARDVSTNQFTLTAIPDGNYTSVSFNIGIEPVRNIANGLPSSANNLNMEWPELMGGGYHFLKMEGYFVDSCCTPGFAMHMGTNDCLIIVTHPEIFSINANNYSLQLTMNVNEWFKNPDVYDFNTDGNYSMGNMMSMMKLARNGKDVFNK